MQQTPATARYAKGQVWEYRTRRCDEGSLLKIQKVEPYPSADGDDYAYHLSVIGVRLGEPARMTEICHVPVSSATLDASVTNLSTSRPDFPDPDEGISIWRDDEGGIFDIAMADVVQCLDETSS